MWVPWVLLGCLLCQAAPSAASPSSSQCQWQDLVQEEFTAVPHTIQVRTKDGEEGNVKVTIVYQTTTTNRSDSNFNVSLDPGGAYNLTMECGGDGWCGYNLSKDGKNVSNSKIIVSQLHKFVVQGQNTDLEWRNCTEEDLEATTTTTTTSTSTTPKTSTTSTPPSTAPATSPPATTTTTTTMTSPKSTTTTTLHTDSDETTRSPSPSPPPTTTTTTTPKPSATTPKTLGKEKTGKPKSSGPIIAVGFSIVVVVAAVVGGACVVYRRRLRHSALDLQSRAVQLTRGGDEGEWSGALCKEAAPVEEKETEV